MKGIKLVAAEHEAPTDSMEHLKEMVTRNKGLKKGVTIMKMKTIKFDQISPAAVNTYIIIMANACEVVTSHLSKPNQDNNYFYDFETLAQDEAMNKVDLANDIQDEITAMNGAYLRADFENLGFNGTKFVWFRNLHNQAMEMIMTLTGFTDVDLTILREV